MPNYLFIYHGGTMPETPEEGEKMMAAWGKWFSDMGGAVVDGGNPVGKSSTVSAKGISPDGGANPAGGYTVVAADDMAGACALAEGCPMVSDGNGTIEVAQIMPM